jgi:hypothetical protein
VVLFAAVHESGSGTKLLNARALVCPEELAKADMRTGSPPMSNVDLEKSAGCRLPRAPFALHQLSAVDVAVPSRYAF